MWSWIVERFTLLQNVLDLYYYRIINSAINAYNWAVTKANAALVTASYYIDNAKDLLTTRIIYYYNEALSFAQSVKTLAISYKDWLLDRIFHYYYLALGYADLYIGIAKQWLIDYILVGLARLQEFIDILQLFVDNLRELLYTKVIELRDWIIAEIETTFPAEFFELIENVKGVIGFTTSFVSNPLGVIMSFLIPHFLELVSYSIGTAIGTVDRKLPPPPDWFGGNFVIGGVDNEYVIDAGKSLVNPLSSISISGYTFSAGHKAIDLGCVLGQQVHSMHSGTVLVSGWSTVGYGNYIIVSGGKYWTLYAHLSALGVGQGSTVQKGQTIGLAGSTGNSSGVHLHLEIKIDGVYIDPVLVLS